MERRVTPLQRAAYQDLLAGGLQRIEDAEVRRLILEYGKAYEMDGLRQQANQEWFASTVCEHSRARAYFMRILRDARFNLLARLEDLEVRIAPE